jgi:hypothetical protein
MNQTIDMVTLEEVQRNYNAVMDSVNLLNAKFDAYVASHP